MIRLSDLVRAHRVAGSRATIDPSLLSSEACAAWQSVQDRWRVRIEKAERVLAEKKADRLEANVRSPNTHDLVVASAQGDLRHRLRLRDEEAKAVVEAMIGKVELAEIIVASRRGRRGRRHLA